MSAMETIKKKGNIRVRANQIEMIVEEMEGNPFLNGTKFTSTYTASKRNADWEELAKKLNTAGGAIKKVKCWQKCWSDKKGDVKKRNNTFKAASLKTGGGRNEEKPLTPLEERILRLIGLDAADGLGMPDSELVPEVNGFHDSTPDLCADQATLERERTYFGECLLPDTADCIEEMDESSSFPRSGTPQINTPQATPETKDARVQSFKKRVRSKPLFMKNENAQKLVEVQTEVAKALKRCAEAMEKQNELKERALEIENRKADAFVGILHLLENKLC
ncbi:hypothetical protein AVEN_134041-1 [Araneus ventricosus]|uniref:Regulatory protein zeste n=1 Tax=Araneus ventricosus TaxID=182803 RepID=A0A4Y2V665_ARAVE|nr:hypothetical protein AVEN_134041-1 [Araneus ventricosus]